MTESNNNNSVEDRSKRRKKKSKNNRREFFSTHEINEVNNTKAKTVNNNQNCTHPTAVNDKLVNNNKRRKEKKESNTKLVGNDVQSNCTDNNNLSTFYRRKNRKIHHSVIDVQQFNAIEDKPCTVKKRIVADQTKKEFNENSKNKLCENVNNKNNHQNNLQLSTKKFNERSEKSFITRTINNNRLNNNSSNNDMKNNQFSHFKSQNNTHKLFPIHTKTKTDRTTYYIEIQRPGHVNEPTTINNNDTVNINSSDLDKRDKIWDFYSHNGQNTYSINNCNANNQTILNNATFAENLRKNEHTTIKNSELPITEPSWDDCGNPEPRIRANKKCTDRETFRKNHRALLKYPVTNYCDSKCNNYFVDDENPEKKKQNDDDTYNNNKVSESTPDKNTFAQTSSNDDPYYCKENNSLSSCDDQNEYEGNENDSDNSIKYNSKCMGKNVYFTNENCNNWTAASLRYDHRKESNTEIEDNDNNDYDTQIDRGVINFDRFVKHFDKIWENVIQEISGY